MVGVCAAAALFVGGSQHRWRAGYYAGPGVPDVMPEMPGMRVTAASWHALGIDIRLSGLPGGPYAGIEFDAGVYIHADTFAGGVSTLKPVPYGDNRWSCEAEAIDALIGEHRMIIAPADGGRPPTANELKNLAAHLNTRHVSPTDLADLPLLHHIPFQDTIRSDLEDFWYGM